MILIVVKFNVKPDWADRWMEHVRSSPRRHAPNRATSGSTGRAASTTRTSGCWSRRSRTTALVHTCRAITSRLRSNNSHKPWSRRPASSTPRSKAHATGHAWRRCRWSGSDQAGSTTRVGTRQEHGQRHDEQHRLGDALAAAPASPVGRAASARPTPRSRCRRRCCSRASAPNAVGADADRADPDALWSQLGGEGAGERLEPALGRGVDGQVGPRPARPAHDEMLTMSPPPAASSSGIAARLHHIGPSRLAATIDVTCASSASASSDMPMVPALFTRSVDPTEAARRRWRTRPAPSRDRRRRTATGRARSPRSPASGDELVLRAGEQARRPCPHRAAPARSTPRCPARRR